tara:strand:- start:154 stop:519 length:366 start_codon:yes stop_codon:yes gene_type:complete
MEEEEEAGMLAEAAPPEEDTGEDLEEQMGEEEELEGEGASLEDAVSGLIANWNPTTPEGEQYLQELQEALDTSAGGGMGLEIEVAEGGPPGGPLAPPSEFGFEIGMMGKEAARRAMGGGKK